LRVDDVAAARTELESPGVLQGPGRQPPDPAPPLCASAAVPAGDV